MTDKPIQPFTGYGSTAAPATQVKPIPQPVLEGELVDEPATRDPASGFKVLQMSDIGAGKTHSLRSLIGLGLTPCILATEPGIESVLGDLPVGSYHLHYIAPGVTSWADMITNAKLLNSTTLEAIAKMGDIKKGKFQQYLQFIETCASFKCDITGKVLGPVDEWNTDRVFCLDTYSGFNKMCKDFIVGAKPVLSQLDWQAAQNINMQLMDVLTNGLKCHVVVNAHVDREQDEVLGATRIMVSGLGRKVAPIIPRNFDDVLLLELQSDGARYWNSIPGKALLKSRHLPRGDKLTPDFKAIFENWKLKGGVVAPSLI
jgi:hypothetical protein